MKKQNLQNVIIACLIAFSLSCYIFLNSSEIPVPNAHSKAELEKVDQKNQQEVMLPDVKVIKTLIQKGRDVLPAS